MKFVVKSTTKCGVLDLLCPHTCRGCGCLGAVLCGCCKNNLMNATLRVCPLCQKVLANAGKSGATWRDYKCEDCQLPFDALFVGGWREGVLAQLVKEYKYQAVRAAGEMLVEILDKVIPELPVDTIVVPLPTIGRHVRERGLDHTLLSAKKLARRRGWKCQPILRRAEDTVQVGTKASERQEQAKRAYEVARMVDNEANYLLLDDVWTTGASMLVAGEKLRQAGAKSVMGAVLVVGRDQQKSTD